MSSELLFELCDVGLRRADVTVFERLDLKVEHGAQTAILGPNGAGKSSLVQLLTRDLYPLHRPETVLRILGRDRWRIWELKQQIGIVSAALEAQHRRRGGEEPMALLTALEIAASGFEGTVGRPGHRERNPEHEARGRKALEALGIEGLRNRVFDTLSSGEQRRVLLARALVHRPHTLVLDEPTAGLDLKARFGLLAELRRLAREETTLVLVTHLVHEILPEITDVILLKEGRVVAHGPKDELLEAEQLSALYDVEVDVVERGGWYDVLPK